MVVMMLVSEQCPYVIQVFVMNCHSETNFRFRHGWVIFSLSKVLWTTGFIGTNHIWPLHKAIQTSPVPWLLIGCVILSCVSDLLATATRETFGAFWTPIWAGSSRVRCSTLKMLIFRWEPLHFFFLRMSRGAIKNSTIGTYVVTFNFFLKNSFRYGTHFENEIHRFFIWIVYAIAPPARIPHVSRWKGYLAFVAFSVRTSCTLLLTPN